MTITETTSKRENRTTYIVVSVVVLALVVVSLLAYHSGKSSQAANQKAVQLNASLTAAGYRSPSPENLVRVLGDDGGAVCADPNAALKRATLLDQIMNGAAGPGMRPVIIDRRAIAGQLLIMKVYCPSEVPDFQDFVNSLNLDNSGG